MNKSASFTVEELREKLRQIENRHRSALDLYAHATTATRVAVPEWNLLNNEF